MFCWLWGCSCPVLSCPEAAPVVRKQTRDTPVPKSHCRTSNKPSLLALNPSWVCPALEIGGIEGKKKIKIGPELRTLLRFEIGQSLVSDIGQICDFYTHNTAQQFKAGPDLVHSIFPQTLIILGKNNYNFTPQMKAFCP